MSQDLLLNCEETTIHAEARSLETEAEDVLREIAYVLQLTRRVRAEIETGAR